MNELSDYKLVEADKQIEKDGTEYEIYGRTEYGTVFERSKDKDELLYHAYHGIKYSHYYDSREHHFFRYGDSRIFLHYRDIEDYRYSDKIIKISKEEIEQLLKEYIYLKSPNLHSRTLMGYKDKGVLSDPNYCTATLILDDGITYTVIKRYDTVKVYEGKQNKFAYNKCEDEANPYTTFKLKEDLYEKALEFSCLRRKIIKEMYGKFDSELMLRFIEVEKYLKENLNI